MKRLLFVIGVLFGLGFLYACTGSLDWTGKKFPCDKSHPCVSGYECVNGVCMPEGSTADTGTGQDTEDVTKETHKSFVPKVAFLYIGPVGDFGWTWAHEQGRKYLDKLGYQTTYAEAVSPPDAPSQIEEFINKGYNVIVGTSYDFLTQMLTEAAKHPDIKFLECSGFQSTKNLGSYFGRLYQVEWLAGMVAGAMTKTNKIGIVSTIAIPEVVRHINAFVRGVKAVNPKAVVIVKWVGNWFDPKKEPVLTQELLDENCDVIHSHTDTSIPLEKIENKGGEPLKTKDGHQVWTIGYDASNACSFGPRTCLTSAYWNWGPMVERLLKKMEDGTWDPSKLVWEQIRNDKNDSGFYLADLNSNVPGDVRIQVQTYIPKLAKPGVRGQQLPFEGPVKDNHGKIRLANGQHFTDDDLLRMCWYVDGVVNPDGTPAEVPSECKGDR